ncbi:MAG: SHOCT domain-containing protein [Alphaproteobacteria bacterium]|nr:SHOCT domain-containing protein [Alphaproteobacteria bacterium]
MDDVSAQQADTKMLARGSARILAAVAAAWLSIAAGLAAQETAPAASPSIGSAAPLDRPVTLRPQFVPEFAFVTEALNLGRVPAGSPQRAILFGHGTAAPRANVTIFRLWVDRLHLDGRDFGGGQPLVVVDGEIQPGPQKFRTLSLDTTGFAQLPASGYGVAPSRVVQQAITAFLDALFLPPRGPTAMATPVVDLTPALQRDLARMIPSAALMRAVAPATVVGGRAHDGRPALVAALRDEVQLNVAGQAIALDMESEFLLDQETALPIMIRTRMRGLANNPPPGGPVDYVVRSYVALPGMQDPMQHLATAPVPAEAQVLPPFPERPKQIAPKAPAAAKPAPAREAAPKPDAAPAKPPAPAKAAPRPASPSGDDIAARLQALKDLRDRGLITPEQYEAKQKEILGRL